VAPRARTLPCRSLTLHRRRVFTLAKDRDLDLDFHVDENGNARARGLRYVAAKAVQHGYQGRIVAGHCWREPAVPCAGRACETSFANTCYHIPATQQDLWWGVCLVHCETSLCSALEVLAPLSSVRGWVPEAVLLHACAFQPCIALLDSWSPTVLDLAGLAVCSGQHAARCMRPLCPCKANSRGGGSLILSPVLNCL